MIVSDQYIRKAKVVKVVDGDTVYLDVDLGCDTRVKMSCRLAGLNTPELNTPAGRIAKTWMESVLPVGAECVVQTTKDRREKYGRYLATIYHPGITTSINEQLVNSGMAVAYMT